MNRPLLWLAAIALSLAGCAGMADVPLGIPSSSSHKFFTSMTAVAAQHGMQVSQHQGSLNIKTAEGDWMQYMTRPDGIHLVVLANTDGLTPEGIEQRKAKLIALSQQLVAEGRTTAVNAKAFE